MSQSARLFLSAVLAACSLSAEIRIVLNKDFVDKYKNRVTISDDCFVDKAHQKPNPPSKDGDIHIAVRCSESALPAVAEIMNARFYTTALAAVKAATGATQKVPIRGAWRIWCEHGGNETFSQTSPDAVSAPFLTTNPDHVFEIHPVLEFNGIPVEKSLRPIQGFTEKDAATAFTSYERTRCRLQDLGSAIAIQTVMAGFNYVKFRIELREAPNAVEDGYQAMAYIKDLDDELLVRRLRVVVPAGTPPYQKFQSAAQGSAFTVLGIPRINLSLVSYRIAHAASTPEMLDWDLPYEMIIAGIYP